MLIESTARKRNHQANPHSNKFPNWSKTGHKTRPCETSVQGRNRCRHLRRLATTPSRRRIYAKLTRGDVPTGGTRPMNRNRNDPIIQATGIQEQASLSIRFTTAFSREYQGTDCFVKDHGPLFHLAIVDRRIRLVPTPWIESNVVSTIARRSSVTWIHTPKCQQRRTPSEDSYEYGERFRHPRPRIQSDRSR